MAAGGAAGRRRDHRRRPPPRQRAVPHLVAARHPAALAVPKLRAPVAALILAPPLLDWADRRPPLDPARYVAARLLDDAAYSLGVWQGCLARRTGRPLLPQIGGRPGKRQPG